MNFHSSSKVIAPNCCGGPYSAFETREEFPRMIAGELTSYDYVANLTAELRGGTRKQFQNVSGDVTAVASDVSAVAMTAALSAVTSRVGRGGSRYSRSPST